QGPRALRRIAPDYGSHPHCPGRSERREGNCRKISEGRTAPPPARHAHGQAEHDGRQAERRPGHDRTVPGEPAALRIADWSDARVSISGQGHAREPQEIPQHPPGSVLSKQLVVNADDFGFTPDVNAGIVETHQRGILTATTLM